MNENNKELFWDATIEEVKRGFIEEGESYKCIICEEEFTKGRIYEIDSMLYDAKKATELHIEKSHGSSLEYLLGMNSTFTGISEVQRELLVLIASGLTDKEIALKIGVAHSTIRNHRFKLREKEKQARLFLAMMEIISSGTKKKIKILEKDALCDAHKTATILDDRYNITDKEKESIIKNYMDESGAVKTYPAKEKKKIIVLAEIVKNFSKGRKYSEKEINSMLKRIYEDYAIIRRALIEYGFIERTNDCSSYWIKE
ncbi:DUF2087 domain-containing protein [Clostridium gasigenes]|uniref:Uncharacterized protein n=1 Tax=Clostridium gasigenes TaxID=94869 RepID=A0A1H0Q6S6_9CLOT|nr:DUF2087 domain-containing protein [Clostridium gasigenes]MBB6623313.1 DUF2087 domain-containing protein [Clostridium gasigenes]MBU3088062.1 DUF2087 domain-containing protein [Clostridium gasigenes]SDP13053.1 hypothetical protein SAMN04488529_102237 [Clostridium gasigenes]